MSDVFVSYKAEDRRRVKPLVEALEADGFSVWWDEQIGGGATWRHAIEAELNDAKCVVVAWSKRSVGPEGTFVHDEATRAQQRHVYVPITIDKVHLPLGFGETQALPLTSWKGNRSDPRYQAVLTAVRRILGDEATGTAPRPVVPAPVSRRAVVVVGAVAAVAAAGVGGWMLFDPDEANAGSIAVLPFANLSGDPTQDYFSDGIAEELRSALSRIAGLKVVARTSSEAVRNDDAETAARKLDVANILTGSVRRSPSTIRVSAQLVDGEDGLELWSESFDRPLGDILQIQSGIAESVAQALSIRLAGADRNVLSLGGTGNPAAQDLFFQARPERLADTEADLHQGIALLDAAIALDPNFAEAHATKAIRLSILAGTYALDSAESRRGQAQALASANRAIAIAPRMARGYA
ncbi:MAG TPA: TIR domain-containing protein, partial [Sphingomicrobium sp.]|nr:TIR domain-containing protein [Sphingomicrobium sp.]